MGQKQKCSNVCEAEGQQIASNNIEVNFIVKYQDND